MLGEERQRGMREHARQVGQNNPIISAQELIALLDEIAELREANEGLEELYKTVPLSAYSHEELHDELAIRCAPFVGSFEQADLIRRNAALRIERDHLRAALGEITNRLPSIADPTPDMALGQRIEELEAAAVATITAFGPWESLWMYMCKGYITDEEYAALQRLGALVGMADPQGGGEGDDAPNHG